MPGINELNIGHSIVARALFVGMEAAVREMKARMVAARRGKRELAYGSLAGSAGGSPASQRLALRASRAPRCAAGEPPALPVRLRPA